MVLIINFTVILIYLSTSHVVNGRGYDTSTGLVHKTTRMVASGSLHLHVDRILCIGSRFSFLPGSN